MFYWIGRGMGVNISGYFKGDGGFKNLLRKGEINFKIYFCKKCSFHENFRRGVFHGLLLMKICLLSK